MWFTDEVWEILERCWAPQQGDRPNIEDVLQCMEKASRSWMPPPPQLLAVPSTSNPLKRGFSDTTTMGSTDRNVISPSSQVAPPQPLGGLDQEKSAGILNVVGLTGLLDGFSR